MRARRNQVLEALRRYESRNITFVDSDGSWPIVWERARGSFVWDTEGKRYLDLTAAFGVAAAGHANRRVVHAGQKQMARLLHAMGDVHPHPLKAQLAAALSRITFERWSNREGISHAPKAGSATGKVIFCNSGFEAVEAGLKTALLATQRAGVVAFEGGYHGLGYGALNVTERDHFRRPFLGQIGRFSRFVEYPTATGDLDATEARIAKLFARKDIGAIVVEPVQARGGINVPPPGFLPLVRGLCDQNGVLLILDEIYTGFGRTGHWFACEHGNVVPDIICLGKALTGGFPMSVCIGRADLMDSAWPKSTGEAIHTSTFLGHPVGCAMALAQIEEIGAKHLPERAATLGNWLLERLRKINPRADFKVLARGQGLLVGLEVRTVEGFPATDKALEVIKAMLHRGFILLPEGKDSNTIALTPPLTITKEHLHRTVTALEQLL